MTFTDVKLLLKKMNGRVSCWDPIRVIVVGIPFVSPWFVANLSERDRKENHFGFWILGAKRVQNAFDSISNKTRFSFARNLLALVEVICPRTEENMRNVIGFQKIMDNTLFPDQSFSCEAWICNCYQRVQSIRQLQLISCHRRNILQQRIWQKQSIHFRLWEKYLTL